MDTKPWYQSKTIIAGIATALAGLGMLFKVVFKVDISDQIPILSNGLLGALSFIGAVVVIYGRATATKTIGSSGDNPTNATLRGPGLPVLIGALILLPSSLILLPSCANGPASGSPAAQVGTDFQAAVTAAISDYATYKSGNVDLTWALGRGAWAYQFFTSTSADVKSLVKAWTGNTGDSQKLADRLARIFAGSSATPEAKTAAIAAAAQSVAALKSN